MILRTHNAYLEGRTPGQSNSEGFPTADPDRVDAVLDQIQQDPGTSSRRISHTTGIPRTSVLRILKTEEYHAFYIQKVQSLNPGDYQNRINFFERMIREFTDFMDR